MEIISVCNSDCVISVLFTIHLLDDDSSSEEDMFPSNAALPRYATYNEMKRSFSVVLIL